MKILEKILAVTAILSVVMIYLTIPWGYAVFLFSMVVLSWMYWPLGFAFLNGIRFRHILKREAYSGIGIDKLIPASLTGAGIALLCIAIVFWVSRYLYGEILLYAGFFFSIIAIIIVMVIAIARGFGPYRKMITRLIILNGIALVVLFMPRQILEQHYDPFSFDPYKELSCYDNWRSTDNIKELLIEVNELLDEETNIRKIETYGNYLLVYCEKWFYRINPDHASLHYFEQAVDEPAHMEFRKIPGKPRIEFYIKGIPERVHWEEKTTQLFLPDQESEEFVKGLRRIYCLLGK